MQRWSDSMHCLEIYGGPSTVIKVAGSNEKAWWSTAMRSCECRAVAPYGMGIEQCEIHSTRSL